MRKWNPPVSKEEYARFIKVWRTASCIPDVCRELKISASAARGRAHRLREGGMELQELWMCPGGRVGHLPPLPSTEELREVAEVYRLHQASGPWKVHPMPGGRWRYERPTEVEEMTKGEKSLPRKR